MIRNHAALEEYFIIHCIDNILPYTLETNYDPMISRILFLCHALITSDTCTDIRLNKLLNLLLPSSLVYITNNDNIDLRENTIQLCNTILHTNVGYELLHNTYHSQLLELIATREKYLIDHIIDNNTNITTTDTTTTTNSISIINKDKDIGYYTKEEVSHEINLLKKLRQLSNLPTNILKYPKNNINNATNITTSHNNFEYQQETIFNNNTSNTLLSTISMNQSRNPDDSSNQANNTQQIMLLPSP